MLIISANIGRIGQLLPKGGRAGGSPAGWGGGWVVEWAATNFPDRVCDNKASCKKSAHLDQKWARNGCFKFSRLFWGGGGRFWIFLEFWGPKWAQKYPILLVELLEMAITTFPAILSQIRDGSIFVKIARGYPCKISRKLTRHRFGPKSQGR